MKNIFISRPTFVHDHYQKGLTNFLNFLTELELYPRTLGVTDYPQVSPLDEVINIMLECQGAIILGYPQVEVNTGFIKGEMVGDVIKLATEWNHIEAALAYEMKLPLLVIHDNGIKRGIFDHGTLNAYIHEIDLSSDGWCLEKRISGSISTWKSRLNDIDQMSTSSVAGSDKKLLSLKNSFLQILDRTKYKKHGQSISDEFDYSGYKLNYGLTSPLSEFLRPNVNPGYQANAAASGIKTKNEILREINDQYPKVYAELLKLFNKNGANLTDIHALFDSINT